MYQYLGDCDLDFVSRIIGQEHISYIFSSPEPLAHSELMWSSTIASKDISNTTGWLKTKLGRNDPYMTPL